MHGSRTEIAVIHDGAFEPKEVVAGLEGYFSLREVALDDYLDNGSQTADLYVFCTSLRSENTFRRIKKAVEICDGEKLFVLPTHNSTSVSRLRDLRVEDHLHMPVDGRELRAVAKKAINRRVESSWATLGPTRHKALKTSLACFEKSFDNVRRGEPLPMDDVHVSAECVRDAAALGGIDGWIDALDQHHNYSFRHSMFVCGTLSYFCHAMGIDGGELHQLTVGGLLHDIGKSMIPLEILDKPGRLDECEWRTMKRHPEHSRDILLREMGLEADVIAMVVHHHEKLDGGGYPDCLSGARINDHVRLTAIADVFSALIDKRAYKGSMRKEDALDLMTTFKGHLDMDLVREFRSFVLDGG